MTASTMATGTIENNDEQTIAINSVTVGEGDSNAVLNVTISPPPADGTTVEVTYSLSANSAGSSDYDHTPVPLMFTSTNTEETISIDITDDSLNEDRETITVQLVSADSIDLFDSGAGAGIGIVTILDNDGTLPVVVLDATMQSVPEGTAAPQILVKLENTAGEETASGRTVTVQFAMTEGSADDPLDYKLETSATNTITFMPGTTSMRLPIEIISDAYDEDNEQFMVTISSPSQATLGTDVTNTITIEDDDDAPVASIATEVVVTETDADLAGTITVTLDEASGKTVTVPYTVATGTALAADYTLTAGDLVFEPGTTTTITELTKDISFMITGDRLDEGEEQFTITLEGSTLANATINDSAKLGTVKITDNDPEPSLSIANVGEPEGTAIEFAPTLGAISGARCYCNLLYGSWRTLPSRC